MPTTLGNLFYLHWEGVPPGMSLQDNIIWQRFRPTASKVFVGFYANVRVGDGQKPLDGMDEDSIKLLGQLTQHRIDIILWGPEALWIVEVRNNAGSGALGTILTNSQLYGKDPVLGTTFTKVILTNDMDDDSRSAAEAAGVLVLIA